MPSYFRVFEFSKHCIRSQYNHCKGKTINSIIKSITDYLKYHKTSYSVYETFKYGQKSENMTEVTELLPAFAKFIYIGNYVRIGKLFENFF